MNRAKIIIIGLLSVTAIIGAYIFSAEQIVDAATQYNSSPAEVRNAGSDSTNGKENYYSSLLASLPLSLHPGTDHRADSKATADAERRCRSVVYQTLEQLPTQHISKLKELTLFYTTDGRRGLGGNGTMVLRCLDVTRGELASVLTHEMGHIVDSDVLVGQDSILENVETGFHDFSKLVTIDDLSLKFYKITWETSEKRKESATELDFVSGYAMSDPFEDFAETYAFYRIHGHEFRALTFTSQALKQKYEFMKKFVFDGDEFELEETSDMEIWSRHYDVTILPFNVQKFLGI